MQLYIMRHGQAENIHISTVQQDAQRLLTQRGKDEALSMAKIFSGEKLEQAWVSPFIRAQQTYQQVAGQLVELPIKKTINEITPSGVANQFHDYLDAMIELESIGHLLIVSHMPFVSNLVSVLTKGQTHLDFSTATIAHLDYNVEVMSGCVVDIYRPEIN